jgi:hypothetical protein
MGDRAAAILVAIVIIIFPLSRYITVPPGILGYLWVRYLKYLGATKAATREQISN